MVLNEEAYVEYTLKSMYDFFEEIIIVEGATQYALNVTPDGLSTDRTAEIIKDFPDPENKIVFRQVGWVPSKRELRNMSLRIANIKQNDILMIQDYDEVWTPEAYATMDNHFKDPNCFYLFTDYYQIFGDFDHREDNDARTNDDNPLTARGGQTVPRGRSPERAVRYTPDMQFISHVNISDVHRRFLYEDPAYERNRVKDFSIGFWHYGYVHPLDRVVTKRAYYARQNGEPEANPLDMMKNILGEWHTKYCRTGEGDNIIPLESTLVHPDVMKSHPYYGKTLKEVVDPNGDWEGLSDPEFFQRVVRLCDVATENRCPENILELAPPTR
jgi:hypothetical protein